MIRPILVVCCVLAWATDARAQTVTDERVWVAVVLQERGAPDSPWRWTLENFIRTRDGVDGVDVIAVRPILSYALTARSMVGGGYALARSFPAGGGPNVEQRIFGQYLWSGAAAGGTLTLRTRLEARFIEANSGVLGRLRQQVRFSHAVRKGSRISVVGYDELLLHLNDTSRNARGIDQNRVFAGVSVTARSATRVEMGYLNQFSPGHRGAPDKLNHILSGAVSVLF